MNMKDIAVKCGVSVSTVSRVINRKPGVNPKMREQIQKIIDENGFRPNQIAKNLLSSKSENIGVVLPMVHSYFTKRIMAVTEVCQKNNYGVMMVNNYYSQKNILNSIYSLYEKRVDGILYFESICGKEQTAALKEINKKIPIVLVDQELPESEIPCVVQDNYNGSRKATEYLIEKGHRKLLYISGPSYDWGANLRKKAFTDVLKKNGIDSSCIREGKFSLNSGYKIAKEVIQENNDITAVFCANDDMAIGAIAAIKDLNLNIPEDISVIGFDDIDMANYIKPRLSTVRQDHYGIGEKATELLIDIIKNKKAKIKKIYMDYELIIRESTN
ncbi:MAG: LacI family DNA-binding transcriptional regulator [Thermotogae bacterium]|nr:LacI family DNA-binding transcriptional regulator [Thermotogota bacterium]MCP5465791.1 LacI family DNA-binding transcriptional regulator [Thermotogota bacterium]